MIQSASRRNESHIGKAAVLGVVAVVPHDEDMSLGHGCLRILAPRLFENIVLCEELIIDEDAPLANLDRIPRHGNHALDEVAAGVARVLKDKHVPLLGRMEPVDELIDDKTLLRFKRRTHGRPIDNVELDDKGANEHRKSNGDDNGDNPVLDLGRR